MKWKIYYVYEEKMDAIEAKRDLEHGGMKVKIDRNTFNSDYAVWVK